MATFSELPALQVQQPDLGGAITKALQASGMSLDQHMQRWGAISSALQELNLENNGTGISKNQWNSTVTNLYRQGTINAQDAAKAISQGSDDPRANAALARNYYASIHNTIQAVTPGYGYQDVGSGYVRTQANPNAPGGAAMPNALTRNMTPGDAASPVTVPNANGTQSVIPKAQFAGAGMPSGQNKLATPPGIATIPDRGAITTKPLAPSGPQIAQQTTQALNDIPAKPYTTPPPGYAESQTILATNATKDFQGTVDLGASVTPQISALQELLSAAPGAIVGAAGDKRAFMESLSQVLPFASPNLAKGASNREIMDKASSLLATTGVTGMGQATDAKLLAQMHATPNSSMTPAAIKATGAMVYGAKLWQKNFAEAAQEWSKSHDPSDYQGWNQFKLDYQNKAPSPLVLSLPYMPVEELKTINRYVKSLPQKQREIIYRQVTQMSGSQ